MATPAQVRANQANAAHSTGPRTDAGRDTSSRNATTHGFTTGVFEVDAEDQPFYKELEAALLAQATPEGALEMDVIRELRDAVMRLRQIRKITAQLYAQFGLDPLAHSDAAAALRKLTRYRATAEMQLYRALDALCDLQLIRVGRMAHLTEKESAYVGPMAEPDVYAFQKFGFYLLGRPARERLERNLEFMGVNEAAELAATCVNWTPPLDPATA